MISILLNIHFVTQYVLNVVDNIPMQVKTPIFLSNVDRHTGSITCAESNSYLLVVLGFSWPMLRHWVARKGTKSAFLTSVLIIQVHYANDQVH